jgi:hypothetical protein
MLHVVRCTSLKFTGFGGARKAGVVGATIHCGTEAVVLLGDRRAFLQAARRARLVASEREARIRPRLVLYSVITVLVVLSIALWAQYGPSFSEGQHNTRQSILLFLVPAITLLLFVMILKRRAAAHEPPRARHVPPLPQVTRIVVHPQPRVAPWYGQQRQQALSLNSLGPGRPVLQDPAQQVMVPIRFS